MIRTGNPRDDENALDHNAAAGRAGELRDTTMTRRQFTFRTLTSAHSGHCCPEPLTRVSTKNVRDDPLLAPVSRDGRADHPRHVAHSCRGVGRSCDYSGKPPVDIDT